MKKIITLAMILLMTVTTAGVFMGCGISGGKDIGRDAALNAALDDAGVSEADTTRLRVSSEKDDGRMIYEVRFDVDKTEYKYEIDASDGKILSVDTERVSKGTGSGVANEQNSGVQDNGTQNPSGANNGVQNSNGKDGFQNGMNEPTISIEQATAIALDRISGATERDIRIERDCDDGQCRYEGVIIYEGKEYKFEIDANTGMVLEWSEEQY